MAPPQGPFSVSPRELCTRCQGPLSRHHHTSPHPFLTLLHQFSGWSPLSQPLGLSSESATGVSSLHRLYFSPMEHRKIWAGRGLTAASPGSQTGLRLGGEGEGSYSYCRLLRVFTMTLFLGLFTPWSVGRVHF